MNEVYTILVNHIGIYSLGVVVMGLYLCALIADWIGVRLWAWLDDSKIPEVTPFTRISMKFSGWKESPSEYRNMWKYYKGKDYEHRTSYSNYLHQVGPDALLKVIGISVLLPLAIDFYIATLIVGSIMCTLYTLRFVRRLSKKFNAHVENKEAHK